MCFLNSHCEYPFCIHFLANKQEYWWMEPFASPVSSWCILSPFLELVHSPLLQLVHCPLLQVVHSPLLQLLPWEKKSLSKSQKQCYLAAPARLNTPKKKHTMFTADCIGSRRHIFSQGFFKRLVLECLLLSAWVNSKWSLWSFPPTSKKKHFSWLHSRVLM